MGGRRKGEPGERGEREPGEPGEPAAVRPVLKWAGGKSQLLAAYARFFPRPGANRAYHEPFFGGGAVFFALRPPAGACLSDLNAELIHFYEVVRDAPAELLAHFAIHQNDRRYYNDVRAQDPAALGDVARASRFLYLNRAGYNGLYRVNRGGDFNVPYGTQRDPVGSVDAANLHRAAALLRGATLLCADFALVVERARAGDFVYFDPPYQPQSATASFTDYTAGSFGAGEQERLAAVAADLDARGCLVMLSNSDVPAVRRLYSQAPFRLFTVPARRVINCRADRRGPVNEVVIVNYDVPEEATPAAGNGRRPGENG